MRACTKLACEDDPIRMQAGSAELTRATATYAVCLIFGFAFLVSLLCGASLLQANIRAVIAATVAHFVSPFLLRPVFGAILDAVARDRAERAAVAGEEAE